MTFRVENYADKNLQDVLREYDSVVKKVSESYLSNVDMHEYSEREKAAILDAQRIIREHHPVVLGDCLDKKTTIKVPEAYLPLLEDIRHLTVDQNNPNRTTIKQQEQIWKSLQKYGWHTR